MAEKKETNVTVTEDNEMDLITGLLKAAEYKTEVQIGRASCRERV